MLICLVQKVVFFLLGSHMPPITDWIKVWLSLCNLDFYRGGGSLFSIGMLAWCPPTMHLWAVPVFHSQILLRCLATETPGLVWACSFLLVHQFLYLLGYPPSSDLSDQNFQTRTRRWVGLLSEAPSLRRLLLRSYDGGTRYTLLYRLPPAVFTQIQCGGIMDQRLEKMCQHQPRFFVYGAWNALYTTTSGQSVNGRFRNAFDGFLILGVPF